MKRPTIFIVLECSGDNYHLFDKTPVAWFFDEEEANRWAETRQGVRTAVSDNLEVEECPGQ